jgi:replicative DNA helicase
MVVPLTEWDEPTTLMLTEGARKVVIDYLEMIEPRLRPEGDLYGVRDWAAKLAGAFVRLAALMYIAGHLKDGYRHPITEDTMPQAARLGDYYATHALGAFGSMTGTPISACPGRAILGWLYPDGSHEHHGEFSRRDAHRQLQERDGHATTAEDIAGPSSCWRPTATSGPSPRYHAPASAGRPLPGTRFAVLGLTELTEPRRWHLTSGYAD